MIKANRGNERQKVHKVVPSGKDFQTLDAREDVVIMAFTGARAHPRCQAHKVMRLEKTKDFLF